MTCSGSLRRLIIAIGVAFFVAASPTAAAEQTALRIRTGTAEPVSEKALRTRAAIKRSDFSAAHEIVTDILANSKLEGWRYYPFSDFVDAVATANDPALEKQLDAWVAQGTDPIPRLIRAQYLHNMAWFVRGGRFVNETPAAAMASFQDYSKKAFDDAKIATTADAGNPHGFLLKLRILRGWGVTTSARKAFGEAIAKYPGYYPLYDTVLGILHPKWGGSIASMYAFVDRHAGLAAEDSPLKLLYLSLYRHLLNAASMTCRASEGDKDTRAQCVAVAMRDLVKPKLEASIIAALRIYDRSDTYQFGLVLEEILGEMIRTGGGEGYSAAILELAARNMHGDTQLASDEPGRNNYIIDKIVAASWYQKGFYENALVKNREALKDIENATFSSEAEKDLAVAAIYQALARAHSGLNQYADMLAYEKAAIALGGSTRQEHLICYGHYRLKAYEEAVQACTKAIAANAGNIRAHYWRGRVYRDLGKPDDALRDMKVVADSQDELRAAAAIDLSMINFGRKDIPAALDVLNTYTYLYDPELTSKTNVAVGYNNRCYAYMQLGELTKALEDCNASLKYGNLPDAYRKQLELIRRLRAQEAETEL